MNLILHKIQIECIPIKKCDDRANKGEEDLCMCMNCLILNIWLE